MKSAQAFALALGLVLVALAVTVAPACDGDAVDVATDGDGGTGAGSVVRASCPSVEPAVGAECLLPENTTCDFGRCGTHIARCIAGAWRFGGNLPSQPACPGTPPESESACPPCWPVARTCSYDERCRDPDAGPGQNMALASCAPSVGTLKWVVTITPCRDGGPDVQGDAGADAD